MTRETARLITDIRTISTYPYVPAVIKMKMVMLCVEWHEAADAREWVRAAKCQDALVALEREYLPLPATQLMPTNEESSLLGDQRHDNPNDRQL